MSDKPSSIHGVRCMFRKAGVPSVRHPSAEHIVAVLLELVDQSRLQSWVRKYAEADQGIQGKASEPAPTPSSNPPQVKIRIQFTVDETLALKHVWPDGDAPEHPTIEDVWKAMGSTKAPSGSYAVNILDDWNLGEHSSLDVTIVEK